MKNILLLSFAVIAFSALQAGTIDTSKKRNIEIGKGLQHMGRQ